MRRYGPNLKVRNDGSFNTIVATDGIFSNLFANTAFIENLIISPESIPTNLFIYVSETGSDGGDGSSVSPYKTIERALEDVRTLGWNDSAEIRILSTGGPYTMPANLNINTGSRGKQRTPLAIRGYNFNPIPGRTLIETQTIVSSSADIPSTILDIVGQGPYTNAQIGQRVRFITGPLSAFPLFEGIFGTVQVDVTIVAVPNPTTLRIAWSAPSPDAMPNPGDVFNIESLDTVATISTFLTLRASNYILFDDLIFSNSLTFGGIIVEGGEPCYLRGVNIRTTFAFLLIGLDSSVILGGNLTNFGISGFVPTTKSLFVNSTGGQFFTTIESGPQNADWIFANAGFVGDGFIAVDGNFTASYFDGTEIGATNVHTTVTNTWILNTSIGTTKDGLLNLRNVRIDTGSLGVSDSACCDADTISLEGGLFVDADSSTSIRNLTFVGINSGINASRNSNILIDGDVVIPSGSNIGVLVDSNSRLTVVGVLNSSDAVGSGASVTAGSSLVVSQDATFDNNGILGIHVDGESAVTFQANLSAQNNADSGLFIGNRSSVQVTSNITASTNGANGAFVTQASILSVQGSFTLSDNTLNGMVIESGSQFQSTGDGSLDNNGGSGILITDSSRLNLITLSSLEASNNASNGITASNRSLGSVGTLTSNVANANFGVLMLSGSKFQVANAAASTMTGVNGDAKIGVNAAATWIQIATQDPAFMTDYLSAQNPTQLCEIGA